MAGIAGIDQLGKEYTVKKMLSKISHRGNAGWHVQEVENATFGIVYSEPQEDSLFRMKRKNEALDGNSPGHQALVKAKEDGLVLKRDPLGVAPLYYGEDEGGSLYFASEVKALVDFCSDIHILPPGYRFDGEQLTSYFELKEKRPLDDEPDIIAGDLKRSIINSIERRVEPKNIVGCWLSGGLDSSALAALCKPRVKKCVSSNGFGQTC